VTTDIHSLSGAYVLDALSDIERAEFDRHLKECDTCALEVRELREATAYLGAAAWSVPAPRLKEQVLGQIAQTRQLSPQIPQRRTAPELRHWRRLTLVAAVAAVAALSVGGVSQLVNQGRVERERAAAQSAKAESDRMAAVMAAPDAQLRSKAVPGGGQVAVVFSSTQNAGVAMLTGLAAPGPGRTYQLWLMADHPISAGVLPAGATSAHHLLSGVRGATFGITNEPAGGSPEPNLASAITVAL